MICELRQNDAQNVGQLGDPLMKRTTVAVVILLLLSQVACADEPPVIPVGLDAYRQWELWPLQRIGARAYMRSTYDRRGGNEGADASHFLYQAADDFNVALDVQGPGILYFARYNHWPPIRIIRSPIRCLSRRMRCPIR
jgi:hypothetical protein